MHDYCMDINQCFKNAILIFITELINNINYNKWQKSLLILLVIIIIIRLSFENQYIFPLAS